MNTFRAVFKRALAWRYQDGVQIFDDDGVFPRKWLATPARCPNCGFEWAVAVRLHSFGFECPLCGELDLNWQWEE